MLSGGDNKFEINALLDPAVFQQKAGAAFDYETVNSYTIELQVIDSTSGTNLTASTTFTIIVDDWNDEIPQFGSAIYSASVNENQLPGTLVTLNPLISASDKDAIDSGNLRYSLSGTDRPFFQINSVDGVIKTSQTLNADPSGKVYSELQIVVTDLEGRNSSANLTIVINDVNDIVPTCDPSIYYAALDENVAGNTIDNIYYYL